MTSVSVFRSRTVACAAAVGLLLTPALPAAAADDTAPQTSASDPAAEGPADTAGEPTDTSAPEPGTEPTAPEQDPDSTAPSVATEPSDPTRPSDTHEPSNDPAGNDTPGDRVGPKTRPPEHPRSPRPGAGNSPSESSPTPRPRTTKPSEHPTTPPTNSPSAPSTSPSESPKPTRSPKPSPTRTKKTPRPKQDDSDKQDRRPRRDHGGAVKPAPQRSPAHEESNRDPYNGNAGNGRTDSQVPGQAGNDWAPSEASAGDRRSAGNYSDPVPRQPGGENDDAIESTGKATQAPQSRSTDRDDSASTAGNRLSSALSWPVAVAIGIIALGMGAVVMWLGRRRRAQD